MDFGLFSIIIILMLVIGIVSHIVSFFLEKKYKNKMKKLADEKNFKSR